MNLDGKWELFEIEKSGQVKNLSELAEYKAVPAEVPGNVEIDLINAGYLPKDI